MIQPFHLAIKTHDLDKARAFYGELLGFEEGRSTDSWIDWNFFGHQLVTHLDNSLIIDNIINLVDNKNIPVPHFGVVLKWEEWHKFAENLENKKIKFIVEPYIRFRGLIGEQATMFFLDCSGNALEFKSFQDESQLFAK